MVEKHIGIVKSIERCDHILIYGAAKNARDAILWIDYLFPEKIIGCTTSECTSNTRFVFNYKVETLRYFKSSYNPQKTCVIVAMRPAYYDEIKKKLKEEGYEDIYSYGDNNDAVEEIYKLGLDKAKYDNHYEFRSWLLDRRIRIDLERMSCFSV